MPKTAVPKTAMPKTAMPKTAARARLPYRRGVGIALVDGRGRVFVAERRDTPGAWQMPQGGIDAGEHPGAAAVRELAEETGITDAEIIAATPRWLRYDLPDHLIGKVWGGRYRGQKQKWYLMRFTGRDADIDLAAHHPEFTRWKWIAFNRLPEVIVGFKKAIYEQVVAEFADRVAALAAGRDGAPPRPGSAKRVARKPKPTRAASPPRSGAPGRRPA